jgi:hypothetical protein
MIDIAKHTCDLSTAKGKIFTCPTCKLTWEYEEGFSFVPEPPLNRKTRERHQRLSDRRK